jgi:hypothetical protein
MCLAAVLGVGGLLGVSRILEAFASARFLFWLQETAVTLSPDLQSPLSFFLLLAVVALPLEAGYTLRLELMPELSVRLSYACPFATD